jgi:hypothetical protein
MMYFCSNQALFLAFQIAYPKDVYVFLPANVYPPISNIVSYQKGYFVPRDMWLQSHTHLAMGQDSEEQMRNILILLTKST